MLIFFSLGQKKTPLKTPKNHKLFEIMMEEQKVCYVCMFVCVVVVVVVVVVVGRHAGVQSTTGKLHY